MGHFLGDMTSELLDYGRIQLLADPAIITRMRPRRLKAVLQPVTDRMSNRSIAGTLLAVAKNLTDK